MCLLGGKYMEYIEIHEQDIACLQSIVEVFRHQEIDEAKALSFINHPYIHK